jgi:hypothetical protein
MLEADLEVCFGRGYFGIKMEENDIRSFLIDKCYLFVFDEARDLQRFLQFLKVLFESIS